MRVEGESPRASTRGSIEGPTQEVHGLSKATRGGAALPNLAAA